MVLTSAILRSQGPRSLAQVTPYSGRITPAARHFATAKEQAVAAAAEDTPIQFKPTKTTTHDFSDLPKGNPPNSALPIAGLGITLFGMVCGATTFCLNFKAPAATGEK